ncbi:hypothetical protein [Microtetraspora malaysiensis]|uniref:hypothetical protein n=1 Tax=Microtetraspora malaysiensis TaxID=161358 RepID=UPI003D8C739C
MSTPPPLMKMDVTIPAWPQVDRARRALDTVRSGTGLLATAAGALAAAAGLFIGDLTGTALVADVALSLGGLATLRLWKQDGHQKATASVMYLAPGVTLAALLVAERIVPGPQWWDALGLTIWTTGMLALRPARMARLMMSPPAPPPSADLAPVQEQTAAVVDGHPVAQWWTQRVAADGGAGVGTALEDIEQTGPSSLRAVIRSIKPGEPVPDISIRRLSAVMDIPEDLIEIGAVPGRGAGVRRLTVGQPDAEADPATVWAQRIAPAAMPGAVLTGIRVGRPGTTKESN